MRMCVSCREMKEKKILVRVVRKPDGAVIIDDSGKASGRGAYICRAAECVEAARKRRAIERSLNVASCEELFPLLTTLCANDEEQV